MTATSPADLDSLRTAHLRDGGKRALSGMLLLENDARALAAIDPRKSEWIRLNAMIDQYVGTMRAELGEVRQARAPLERSVLQLDQLYERNRLDRRVASDLARSLIERAQLAAAEGNRKAMLADCTRAANLIPPVARNGVDHRMLDPWARSQACLGNAAAAGAARATLSRIGYQDLSYLRYMTNKN